MDTLDIVRVTVGAVLAAGGFLFCEHHANRVVAWRFLPPLGASLTLLFLFSPLASGDDEAPQIPPRKEWIDVASVQAEYTYVSAQRSDDGGSYEVQSQCTGVVDGVHFDQLICTCSATGKARVGDGSMQVDRSLVAPQEEPTGRPWAERDKTRG